MQDQRTYLEKSRGKDAIPCVWSQTSS